MKLLLPALCLLALTACTAPQPTAPEASPEQASPETTTVAVTVDLADYTDTADREGIQTDPLFYLDERQDKLADASQAICEGSRVTYQVTVPAGTTDLYVSPLLLRSTETVEEQSAPARGDQQLPDFRVESVMLETQDGQAVAVVAIDPQSAAFPADLTLHTGDMIRTGGFSFRWEWGDGTPDLVREYTISFSLDGSEEEARAALEDATLHWSELRRFTLPRDLVWTADGVTVHPIGLDG